MGLKVDYRLVRTFEEWKSSFETANNTSDVIYIPTIGVSKGWDHEEVIFFIKKSIRIRVLTCDDFMMPYAVLGVTKVQEEQGIKAGEMVLKIREGIEVPSIRMERNSKIKPMLNQELADRINFKVDELDMEEARIFKY